MTTPWPSNIFAAPLLRGLDERGQRELMEAGTLHRAAAGERLYAVGDRGDSVFVVASGRVQLRAVVRGQVQDSEVRAVSASDTFGEEAYVGASRCSDARVIEKAEIAELPVPMLRRALVRAGGGRVAERTERRLRRAASAELLNTAAFANGLSPDDLEMLLDGAEQRPMMRGDTIYRQGEPPQHLWLVADGMVQLQSEDEERLRVVAYLSRGDVFGDEELFSGRPRSLTAVSSGGSLLIAIDAQVARTVADRNPGLLRRIRRVSSEQQQRQEVIRDAASHATQHAFRDFYRLSVARSLLVIDLDSCVRCGHCAWSCEALHGVARLVRRGDKIVTRVGQAAHSAPLLLPNSCQHCENPACMPDCPTGAIGRDPSGEVYIRDALCTGCGACAKGCPWDNIQIVPRPEGVPRPAIMMPQANKQSATAEPTPSFDELAIKCDLCRGYDGPACVKACPTEAIMRLNPADDLPSIGEALGKGDSQGPLLAPRRSSWPLSVSMALVGLAVAIVGVRMQQQGHWVAWRGVGYGLGWLAAGSLLLLWGYVIPKRGLAWWQRRKARRAQTQRTQTQHTQTQRTSTEEAAVGDKNKGSWTRKRGSLVRPQLLLHIALGLVSLGVVFGHAGTSWNATAGAGLASAFLATGLLGIGAAICYALLPRRLSRLEARALLPEDFPAARVQLDERLFAGLTGKSEVVKRLSAKLLVPYARAPLGWLWLLLSGRDTRAERQRVRARIDALLQGRKSERLAGLEELIDIVVQIRALPAARHVTTLLRLWLPLHLVAAALSAALLLLHLLEVLG